MNPNDRFQSRLQPYFERRTVKPGMPADRQQPNKPPPKAAKPASAPKGATGDWVAPPTITWDSTAMVAALTKMTMHRIYMPDLPGGYTMCLCVRGHDHDEADFDIPLGQHGEPIDHDGPLTSAGIEPRPESDFDIATGRPLGPESSDSETGA